MRFAFVAAVIFAASGTASAHITMTSPKPRSVDQKAGPCGAVGSTRGSNVSTFKPGQTITVEWDETVEHPGHYRIAFDEDGEDAFKNPGEEGAVALVDNIVDRNGGGHYTQQVTLPTMTCTNCTLQLIQVMEVAPPYTFYYQCADIVLSDSADPMPTEPGEAEGGCSTGAGSSTGVAALIALGLVLRRRRSQ